MVKRKIYLDNATRENLMNVFHWILQDLDIGEMYRDNKQPLFVVIKDKSMRATKLKRECWNACKRLGIEKEVRKGLK